MKSFKFKYSILVWVLFCVILALALAGLVLNVILAVNNFGEQTPKAISNVVMAVLCLAILVFVTWVMIYGKYTVTKDFFSVCFGFIKLDTKLDEIVQIVHFKKSDKLVMYFSSNKYTVVVISPRQYKDFILEVRQHNPSVIYNTKFDGEDTP